MNGAKADPRAGRRLRTEGLVGRWAVWDIRFLRWWRKGSPGAAGVDPVQDELAGGRRGDG
jgi:hypothetical protein